MMQGSLAYLFHDLAPSMSHNSEQEIPRKAEAT